MNELLSERIGICLSSGYFGYYAHCGVMQAIKEAGIRPVAISGCSAGAVVGALWASGLEDDAIERTLLSAGWNLLLDPPPFSRLLAAPGGFVRGRRFERALAEALPVSTFEECPIALSVITFDLNVGRLRVIDTGPLARAVRASSSLPGMFSPTPIDGHLCWDGAVAEKTPIRPLVDRDDVDTVLVCALPRPARALPPKTIVGGLRTALDAVIIELDRARIEKARERGKNVIVISPAVPPSGPSKMSQGARIIEVARRETRRILAEGDFRAREPA
jgi:NTE family protein